MTKAQKTALAFLRRKGGGRGAQPSEKHRKQIAAFAVTSGYKIVAEFSEKMSPGAPFPSARGFSVMLRHIETTGVSTVIVASASEFAPDRIVRAVGYAALRSYRIQLLAADDPAGFADEALTPQLVDQVLRLGACFEKLLARAYREAANERPDIEVGPKHRKRYADMIPEVVELAKNMHQLNQRASTPLSFREISTRLAEIGRVNKTGKPFHPEEIRRMIKGPRPRAMKS